MSATSNAATEIWSITGQRSVDGEVVVPGDKSISHRALMFAGMASGSSLIKNLSNGEDVRSTLGAMKKLGAVFDVQPGGVLATGGALSEPDQPLDLGNAGTGMRLMAGILGGRNFTSILTGDDSLSRRPMDRVITPLKSMGAEFASRIGGLAPLVCLPSDLYGIEFEPPMASAQVKSAVLIAGLRAKGKTVVTESVATRRHTEELLTLFGAKIETRDLETTVWPSQLSGMDIYIPGDPSQAAFWAVASAILPESTILLPSVETSPERTGFINVMQRMGANVSLDQAGMSCQYNGQLKEVTIGADEVPYLIDEIPILAVAAASAKGRSVFYGLGELVHKESNRLLAIIDFVERLGATCSLQVDSLAIDGCGSFRTFELDSGGDHRMAMSGAVAALHADGTSIVSDVSCVDTSYPSFMEDLAAVVTQ